jgi:anti-sigma factor RsiW
MNYEAEKLITCQEFEENLSDYLDNTLEKQTRKAVAAHALRCPLCHALLNEVKDALEVCHEIAVPKTPMTRLEARILSITMPETAMSCLEFEEYLTDYLDGFLPASFFHRWERHAVLCEHCTDLPGEVVRSIAACYTYKSDELPLPLGLNQKILQATIGTENAKAIKASWSAQFGDWVRSLSFPISVPQLAPVAMMLVFAFFVFSQTVSADGSISGMYQKSFELAEQTYKQSAELWGTESNSTEENIPNEGK